MSDENREYWIVAFHPCGCMGAYHVDNPAGRHYGGTEVKIILRHGGRSERVTAAELEQLKSNKQPCTHNNKAMLDEIWQMELLGGIRDPRDYGWQPKP